jgi:hypothetical protein
VGEAGLAAYKKNAKRRKAWIVFLDESGFSLIPSVRSTWAPRGHTPVLLHPFGWKRISAAGMIGYRYDGQRARLLVHTVPGAYNDELLTDVLEDLSRHLRGAKVTLVWDGLPSHRSRLMQGFVRRQRSWLVVERLPAYAPELNPVEGLWSNLKGGEFANRCEVTVGGLEGATDAAVGRVGSNQQLLFSFLQKSGLSF